MHRSGTVHNTTHSPPLLRLSFDIRFQPKADAVDPRHTAHGGVWDRAEFLANNAAHAAAAPLAGQPMRPLADLKREWGVDHEPLAIPLAPARPWPPQPWQPGKL